MYIKLIPVEFENQRILTTEQLAEVYNTESRRISENFNRNIGHFTLNKHYYLLQGEELKEFKNQYAESVVAKNASQLYLWTERGANRHCKILDTDEAWKQFDNLEETYFNVKEQIKPLPFEDMMIMQLEEQKKIKNRLETVEFKIDKQMTIDHGQQRIIQREVGRKVYARVWQNYKLDEYPGIAAHIILRKYFNSLYKEIKNRFGVASYRDIKIKDFELAINYIKNWVEPQELRNVS